VLYSLIQINYKGIVQMTSKIKANESSVEPLKSLQIKIPESVRNEIKGYANFSGLNVHDFVVEMFKEYKSNHSIK